MSLGADRATSFIQVAEQLQIKLLPQQLQRMTLGGTTNTEAHDAFLRGVHLYQDVLGFAGTHAAVAAFDEAIALDPNFAMAYLRKAKTLRLLLWSEPSASPELRRQARQAVWRALALAPDLGEAHACAGEILEDESDFAGADAEYAKALSLSPGSAQVVMAAAASAVFRGRHEQGISLSWRALQLDPQNYRARWGYAMSLYAARQYDQAVSAFQAARQAPHGDAVDSIAINLAWVYLAAGEPQKALHECQSLRADVDSDALSLHECLAIAYHALGQVREAEEEFAKYRHLSKDNPYQNATIYAQWGDKANALHWLTLAVQSHDPYLTQLRGDPLLDPIRKEPEFKVLLRQLNYPP